MDGMGPGPRRGVFVVAHYDRLYFTLSARTQDKLEVSERSFCCPAPP